MKRNKNKAERQTSRRIYILCEGEKTERFYFDSLLKDTCLNIKPAEIIRCAQIQPLPLVERAIREKYSLDDIRAEYWVVFDDDRSPDLEVAFRRASENSINIAFSSISFEFWFLLHYQYTTRPFTKSKEIEKILDGLFEYRKNASDTYDKIKDKLDEAFTNARKVRNHHMRINPDNSTYQLNPFTNVDKLIEMIWEIRDEMKANESE